MPSVSYRAPLLVVSDLGAVAVLRLRDRRARRWRSTSHRRPGTRRPAARAVANPWPTRGGCDDAQRSSTAGSADPRRSELNRSMLTAVLAAVRPFEQLEWGVHMYEAARQLERAAEHAVDIAEQVWFLVTGELQEFGDARAPTPAP